MLKTTDPVFQEGIRKFNAYRFFEAHEAWEELWHRTPDPGPEREIYQGLIQLAAAGHHFMRGNLAGVEGCLKNAHRHLDPHLKDVSEFDLVGFIQAVERSVVCRAPVTFPKLSIKESG